MTRVDKKHVLVTGVTGFVGKVVLAELLRRREELGVAHVYVLIRDKKGKTPSQRFAEDVAPARLFSHLPADWTARVTPVACELIRPQGGLDAAGLALLQSHVTHIIHCAASVEFDLPIHEAAEANITSALNMLEIARGCGQLRRMVSVSTTYVTPWREGQGAITPALVPLPFDPETTYADILARRADEKALMAASGHPNTYTITKCITEHLLTQRRGGVPLSIVRPSIVSATLRQPFPGWIDSATAFAGFVALIGAGQLRTLVANPASYLDVIPCDAVAEVVLNEALTETASDFPRFLHAAAGRARSLNIQMCVDTIVSHFQRAPGGDRRAEVTWIGPLGPEFEAQERRTHTRPLKALRIAARLTGNKKGVRLATRILDKLRYVNRAFRYFTHSTFDFAQALPQTWPGFDPVAYVDLVCGGVNRHILRNDPTLATLAGARHKRKVRSDLRWAMTQPHGNRAIRGFGYVLSKAARRSNELVSFDRESFQRAMTQVPAGTPLVLVPSHRSYMDFLFCSYLFFSHPELGIKIPYIAAAEEFSRIPILGKLFTKTQAFYLRRGMGREDPELTRTVHGLVEKGEVIQFFIEGARSRTRQFLRPRTGLMRCLQATGKQVAVLPIAITYDRVPEEAVLTRELAGEPKPKMQLRALMAWARKMAAGKVKLGRIHLACGAPVLMNPDDDVRDAADAVMAGLQKNTAVSTYHLRCFLARHPQLGLTEAYLRDALRRRGAHVIDSDLAGAEAVDPVTELSLRQQWLVWFYDEALALWSDSQVLQHEVRARRWFLPAHAPEVDEVVFKRFLAAAFGELLRDAHAVAGRLGDPRWKPRLEAPAAVLAEAPGVHVLHAQAIFDDLTERGVLAKTGDGKLYTWGPDAEAIATYRARAQAVADTLLTLAAPVDGREVAPLGSR